MEMSKKKKDGITDEFTQFLLDDENKGEESDKTLAIAGDSDDGSSYIFGDSTEVASDAEEDSGAQETLETVELEEAEETGVEIESHQHEGSEDHSVISPQLTKSEIDAKSLSEMETGIISDEEKNPPDLLSTMVTPVKRKHGVDKLSRKVSEGEKDRNGEIFFSAEASLAQSEHLRLAQKRIIDLEDVVEKLRKDNEQLIAIGESLKNRAEKLEGEKEELQKRYKDLEDSLKEENALMKINLKSKTKDLEKLNSKVEELEARLKRDTQKIRMRERELENRLEIVKLEEAALVQNKNETILELKRKTDQLLYEMNNYRERGRELQNDLEANRERVRRTVRALRLALSMLESEDEMETPLKKVD
jgi:DNA repair exonuclease SbcCD ATPase subunit